MQVVHEDEVLAKTPSPLPKQVMLAASFSRGVLHSKTDVKWKMIFCSFTKKSSFQRQKIGILFLYKITLPLSKGLKTCLELETSSVTRCNVRKSLKRQGIHEGTTVL